MKRVALWVVGAGVTSVALMLALRAQEQQAGKVSTPAPAATAAAVAPGEKVAFTFGDDTQLQQFAQLWQQRQAVLAKMAVLQSYWRDEQTSLGKVNQELLGRYNIDVSKNYTFDPTRKVLIEREAAQQPPTDISQGAPGAVPPQSQPPAEAAGQPAQQPAGTQAQ